MTHTDYVKRRDEKVASALHQIRTRSLRDAPVYLNHVSMAEYEIKQAIDALFLELVGEDDTEVETPLVEKRLQIMDRNAIRAELRKVIEGDK